MRNENNAIWHRSLIKQTILANKNLSNKINVWGKTINENMLLQMLRGAQDRAFY